MLKLAIGFAIAFALGALCRWFELPAPAPPTFVGALLVAFVTAGYMTADYVASRRAGAPATAALVEPVRPPGANSGWSVETKKPQ